ncbi:MAG TPA: FAD-dependent thymidylate synthase, partial [Anaerolineales bacterium]|nr:FAD-dependent thymidylate synthase [Anaerolineales bacterium]
MAPDREIYLLSPSDLSPETIAVAFAKTSRSPLSFREIAAELSDEKSAEFHEKWVVGYGHASVAEHAVLHIAFENVSRLAIECIESNRLASYTEKSTRYQMWGPEDYYLPAELVQSPHAERYRKTCAQLFAAYESALPPLRALVEERFPRREDESRPRWQGRIRSKYVDVARYLLPAAALANVGMTANARAFEHAIRKMLSHPLQEVREIGVEVKAVALRETPTLVKYAEPVDYMQKTRVALQELGDGSTPLAAGDWLELADYDRSAEDKFLAACFYTGSGIPFSQALQAACGLASGEREQVARAALGELGRFDIPLRELEYVGYTFDAVMD